MVECMWVGVWLYGGVYDVGEWSALWWSVCGWVFGCMVESMMWVGGQLYGGVYVGGCWLYGGVYVGGWSAVC